MGYCVQMELRNVKIPLSKKKEAVKILKALNETWHKNSDWCRFDANIKNLAEILEEVGFSIEETDTHLQIKYFEQEKLGDHENMFEKLAPLLEDCEIVYEGEDGHDWKQVIKDHKVKVIYREAL